jgi:hypothetical protein
MGVAGYPGLAIMVKIDGSIETVKDLFLTVPSLRVRMSTVMLNTRGYYA